jgi:8-oxo-dGTP pyrophosphatase MutT (NUDIX family)/2'-5' RNA ligase
MSNLDPYTLQALPSKIEKSADMGARVSALRFALSGGAPGFWAFDHLKELQHMTGWNFPAVHAFGLQLAGARRQVFYQPPAKNRRNRMPDDPIKALEWLEERKSRQKKKAFTPADEGDNTKKRPVPDSHPLAKLLKKPNPDQSGAVFYYQMGQQLALTGGCIEWTVRDNITTYDKRGTTRERYIIPTGLAIAQQASAAFPFGSYRIQPIGSYALFRNTDADDWFSGAVGTLMMMGGTIDARNIRIIGWPHPLYVNDFASAMTAGSVQIDIAEAIDNAIWARMKNQASPGLLYQWESQDAASRVRDEDMVAFRADVRSRNSGTANTGKDMLVPPGLKAEHIDYSPKEMDYANSRPQARDGVFAMHQTPGVVAGITDAGSYSQYYASLRQFTDQKVQPNVELIAEEETEDLCPAFGPGYTIEGKAKSIEDPALEAQKMQRKLMSGAYTNDEYRAFEGDPPHPDPEVGKAPAGKPPQPQGPGGAGGPGGPGGAGPGDGGLPGGGDPTGGIQIPALGTATDTGTPNPTKQAVTGRADVLGKSANLDAAAKPTESEHKYASTQIEFAEPLRSRILSVAAAIPATDLGEEGREDTPHVTVRYGLITDDPQAVIDVAKSHGPITVTLGKTSLFTNPEADVLKLEVASDGLYRLNEALKAAIPHTDKYPLYVPHVTLAYLKPGAGGKYVGWAGLDGQTATINELIFSDRNRNRVVIPLHLQATPLDLPKVNDVVESSDLITKSLDPYSGRVSHGSLPIDSEDARKKSLAWLQAHGGSELAIQNAAYTFLMAYTTEFQAALQQLAAEGRPVTPESAAALINVPQLAERYKAAILPAMTAAAVDGAKLEWQAYSPGNASFDIVGKQAAEESKKLYGGDFWTSLAENLRDRLVASVVVAAAASPAITVAFFKQMADTAAKGNKVSANSIGTTGATNALGSGQDVARDVLVSMGINLRKQWVCMMDGRERPTHHIAHGQIVPYNGKFVVGGHECDFPGDETLPIEETINCRCHAVTIPDPSQPVVKTKALDLDDLMLTKGFTGTVNAKNGATYHYVDGHRVAAHEFEEKKADPSALEQKAKPTKEQSKVAIDKAISVPHELTHDDIAALPDHFANMNMHELRAYKKQLAASGSSAYKEPMVEAIHAKIAAGAGAVVTPDKANDGEGKPAASKVKPKQESQGGENLATSDTKAPDAKAKEPWQMTNAEHKKHKDAEIAAAIEKWNASGSKGFPPSDNANSISARGALAEKAGLAPKSPEYIEAATQWPLHKLHVAAAIANGQPVPHEVLAEYPDLAEKNSKPASGQTAAPAKPTVEPKPAAKPESGPITGDQIKEYRTKLLVEAGATDKFVDQIHSIVGDLKSNNKKTIEKAMEAVRSLPDDELNILVASGLNHAYIGDIAKEEAAERKIASQAGGASANTATTEQKPPTSKPAADPEKPKKAKAAGPITGDPTAEKPVGFSAEAMPEVSYAATPEGITGWDKMGDLPPGKQAYGAVVLRTDPATGKTQVLLREPKDHFDSYVWTWPKGKRDDNSIAPADVAHKELGEETGYSGKIVGHLPQLFGSSGVTKNAFFVMAHDGKEHDPSKMDAETASTKWVDLDKAHELLGQTTKIAGRQRDLDILEAARKFAKQPTDPKIEQTADKVSAIVGDLHGAGDYSPKSLHASLHDTLQPLHPDTIAAVCAKHGVPNVKALEAKLNSKLEAASEFPGFPGSPTAVKPIKGLGGSTGATLVEHNGKNFVMKQGNNPGHIREEHAADSIYSAMDVPVPKAQLHETPSGPVKIAEHLGDAVSLQQYLKTATPAQKEAVNKQLQQHFVMDALLGNWDVIGMNADNVMVDKTGKAWRIDNGGSMRYRAQGEPKSSQQWSDSVDEINTMRDPKTNPQAAAIFGGISKKEIADQVQHIVANKQKILDAAPDGAREMLRKRIDHLAEFHGSEHGITQVKGSIYLGHGTDWASIKPHAGATLKPASNETNHPTFKPLSENEPRKTVSSSSYAPSFTDHMNAALKTATGPETKATTKYTGSGYSGVNSRMRDCPETLDCLDSKTRLAAKHIESAIAKGGTFETPVNVWRNPGIQSGDAEGKKFLAAMAQAAQTGDAVRMPGFKSTSMSPSTSMGGGDIKLEIRAKSGLWVQPISMHQSEKELIQGHNTRYRVVSVKDAKDYPGSEWGIGARKVIQLEEI